MDTVDSTTAGEEDDAASVWSFFPNEAAEAAQPKPASTPMDPALAITSVTAATGAPKKVSIEVTSLCKAGRAAATCAMGQQTAGVLELTMNDAKILIKFDQLMEAADFNFDVVKKTFKVELSL